ncbi:DUF2961 domain-containing protein [Allokutzneria sp. A3M-2-11 16]|uniref:glycoside hydrolase family 172 protein n=1 Tax=Allokutzneria sp. A3M-2-11 16 TaxID=2962043 RepID=UPI0020B6F160|nr:glycoside hydrolase family 172 protein [Allokutzneria sp. A3M-2-11 16]MCP3804112.1 DUF2961 domain-containing protein [Allokutzneria sp. A3M-2-11 16]
MSYGNHGSSLRDLPRLRSSRRRRVSSWDRSGGNDDRLTVQPGQTAVLADIEGCGSITHIWCTVALPPEAEQEPDFLRRLLLKITWEDSADPSVLVPLGDFFGMGHAKTGNFVSAPLQMSPEDGKGFNCWFHMPFRRRARVELISEMASAPVFFYYYIDYETFDAIEDDLGYFHAQWHRANPTDGVEQGEESNEEYLFGGTNTDGAGNYVILEATGRGHYVGCVLNVHNLRQTEQWNWYGEGDDMIFIDGEQFPPSLHGTGTEDYFNTAWCPTQTYSAPYHGITMPGGPNWSGQVSMYRFHVEDPVTFTESIKVTIEHGHANKRIDDVSSVAYWYQTLPHKPFGILPVAERLPRQL